MCTTLVAFAHGTGEDIDEDGLCDDLDDCVGAYDECGVCNGPGPTIPVIDEIIYVTDSVFIESLDEWQVFEYAVDTLFTYSCIGPSECGGISTLTYDGHMYDLVCHWQSMLVRGKLAQFALFQWRFDSR